MFIPTHQFIILDEDILLYGSFYCQKCEYFHSKSSSYNALLIKVSCSCLIWMDITGVELKVNVACHVTA